MTRRKPPPSRFEVSLDRAVALAKTYGQAFVVLESKITHACRHAADAEWRRQDWAAGNEWIVAATVTPTGDVEFVG